MPAGFIYRYIPALLFRRDCSSLLVFRKAFPNISEIVEGGVKETRDERTLTVAEIFNSEADMKSQNYTEGFVAQSPDTQIFSTRYPVTRKVCTGYHITSETEHSLSACTVYNQLAKPRGLSNA